MKQLPNEALERIADAIEAARCPGREGPYGLYCYDEPDYFSLYVARDFRDPALPTYGNTVYKSYDKEAAQKRCNILTKRHIAECAIRAIFEEIKKETPLNVPPRLHSEHYKRLPIPIGYYPQSMIYIDDFINSNRVMLRFHKLTKTKGITANQAREAAHLLNQLAEYLERE